MSSDFEFDLGDELQIYNQSVVVVEREKLKDKIVYYVDSIIHETGFDFFTDKEYEQQIR